MTKPFRRGQPGEVPTQGGLDELLEDPPAISSRGSLAAYQEGSRVRRKVYLALVVGGLSAVVAGHLIARHLEHQRRNPTAHYTMAPGSEDEIRPRSLEWTDGYARLALSREPPGIAEVVLPDRVVRLADGVDTAQFRVNVLDGRTVELKVISGDIEVSLRP